MRTLRRHSGLTTIETCCVAALAATLIGSGIPSLQRTLAARQLEGVAMQIAQDVMYARSEATARREHVRISFKTVTGGTCYVIHTEAAASCSCSSDGQASCTGDAREIKAVFWPASHKVSVTANVGSMLFEPVHGTAVPAGTIKATSADGRAIHQVVNIMGRPRACSPNNALPGYKAC